MFCELLMKYFLQYLLKWKVTDFHMDLLLTPFYCLLVLTCHLNNCNYLFYFEISSVCTLLKYFYVLGFLQVETVFRYVDLNFPQKLLVVISFQVF